MMSEYLGLKMPEGVHQRASYTQIQMIAESEGLEVIEHGYDTLCPIFIPWFSDLINRTIAPFFARLNIFEYFVAKIR